MSELRETWKALLMFGPFKLLYWRFLYRPHMRWLHARGQHKIKTYPIGLKRCDWCGFVAESPPRCEDYLGLPGAAAQSVDAMMARRPIETAGEPDNG